MKLALLLAVLALPTLSQAATHDLNCLVTTNGNQRDWETIIEASVPIEGKTAAIEKQVTAYGKSFAFNASVVKAEIADIGFVNYAVILNTTLTSDIRLHDQDMGSPGQPNLSGNIADVNATFTLSNPSKPVSFGIHCNVKASK